ncbi:MAG: insulinase family protein [Rhodovarius sp.]|nr:insulinase family protein [Rhodovarius sp.]
MIDRDLPPRAPFRLPIRVIEEGGITAWLVEDGAVPVVSLAWAWGGGASLDPEGQEGRAGLAAGMLMEGAGDLDHLAFADAVRDAGLSLQFGAGRDAFSGSLRATVDALPEGLRLARLAMTAPRLDAAAFDRLRARAVVSARQALESPRGVASRAFWAAAFPGHPAGRSATPESLSAMAVDAMREALATQLRRGGIKLAAAGALDEGTLRQAIRTLFLDLPPGAPPEAAPLPPMARFPRRVVAFPAPQSTVLFGQDALAPADPEWEAMQVVLRILAGGGFTSRLMREIREQRGLTYGIGAGLEVLFRRAIILGQGSTDNATAAEMIRLVEAAWERMASEGPTEEELREATDFLAGSLPLQFSDTRRIAGGLLSLMQNDRSPEWLAGRPARLAALTRERVAAAAQRLGREPLRLVVAGQPQGL